MLAGKRRNANLLAAVAFNIFKGERSTHHILFALIVVFSNGKPAAHAFVSCAEISRQTDEGKSGEDDDPDGLSAALVTDSKGWMIFTAPPGTFHCAAWLKDLRWYGTLEIQHDATYTVTIR